MKLKMSATNHLRILWFHITGSIMMLLILYFLNFEYNYALAFGIIWIIYTIPVVWLHIEYWLKNQGEQYEISNEGLVLLKNKKTTKFFKDQIDNIIIYMPPSVYRGSGMKFLAVENYSFARVKLKSGQTLTLTCLLAPKLEDALRQITDVSIKRKKRLFCTTCI